MKTLEDLRGRVVGIPEWSVTATVYGRALLANQVGIPLTEIQWVQAGLNQPGRKENAELRLPEGVRYRQEPSRTLQEMLFEGDIDAILAPHPPAAFVAGDSRICRLVRDVRAVEEAYFQETGIFPIMHVIAIRRAVLEAHPWVAMNLLTAFEEAKHRSLARIGDSTASRIPLAWSHDLAVRSRSLFGEDPWPYGIEANRHTLEAFLQYSHEQGVCHRPVTVDELFPHQVREKFRL